MPCYIGTLNYIGGNKMLKCQYCGKEFSEKVLPFHEERCTEKDKVKTEEKKKVK